MWDSTILNIRSFKANKNFGVMGFQNNFTSYLFSYRSICKNKPAKRRINNNIYWMIVLAVCWWSINTCKSPWYSGQRRIVYKPSVNRWTLLYVLWVYMSKIYACSPCIKLNCWIFKTKKYLFSFQYSAENSCQYRLSRTTLYYINHR